MTKPHWTLRALPPLTVLAALLMAAALIASLLIAPTEAVMGDVQRVFYLHVAASWCGYLALAVGMLASVLYLTKRDLACDALALASSEVGLVFITAGIVTGSIWARPIWGTWWTWDPRLTTSAVLLVIYASYLLLRGSMAEPGLRARVAAVYNIAGFIAVPLNFFAIRWWRALHPLLIEGGEMRIAPGMVGALLTSIGAMTAVYIALVLLRWRIERLQQAIDALWLD